MTLAFHPISHKYSQCFVAPLLTPFALLAHRPRLSLLTPPLTSKLKLKTGTRRRFASWMARSVTVTAKEVPTKTKASAFLNQERNFSNCDEVLGDS